MSNFIERLKSMPVRRLMNPEVVQVRASDTMADAAATLADHHISGVPVADEQGRCVGILSASDFVRRESRNDPEQPPLSIGQAFTWIHGCNGVFCIEFVPEGNVAAHMSRAVQAISDDATLLEAGRMMCVQHVHRLPVLDRDNRAVGIVSSLDLIAGVIEIVEAC